MKFECIFSQNKPCFWRSSLAASWLLLPSVDPFSVAFGLSSFTSAFSGSLAAGSFVASCFLLLSTDPFSAGFGADSTFRSDFRLAWEPSLGAWPLLSFFAGSDAGLDGTSSTADFSCSERELSDDSPEAESAYKLEICVKIIIFAQNFKFKEVLIIFS